MILFTRKNVKYHRYTIINQLNARIMVFKGLQIELHVQFQ